MDLVWIPPNRLLSAGVKEGQPVPRHGTRPGDLRVIIRRPAKLPRTLGASALFAACYGNVGSSIYYALGVTAAYALGLTPVALILAGFIFVTTALNYAEGTAAIPHAGGASSFARRAFNEPIGFIVGWVQLLNYTVTVSISAYFAIGYLAALDRFFPLLEPLHHDQPKVLATLVLIAVLAIVNVIGIQESSLINLVLALVDLATQMVLVLMGLYLLLNWGTVIHNVRWGVAPTWSNFLSSISIAMVTYTGIETISNMSEEAKNPGRAVPRATFAVIVAVLFVSAFLPTVGMSVFPVHVLSGHFDPTIPNWPYSTDLGTVWQSDPVSGIVSAFKPAAVAYWAGVWVAILAFTILVIATNAGLIGISRLSFSLATNDLMPSVFGSLHAKYRTPWVSIVVFAMAGAGLVLPGLLVSDRVINLMAAVYSLAATFAFCAAHLAVMRLRFVEPELHRPYQMPLNVKFGRSSIPLLSLVGALAIGTVFSQLMQENITGSSFIFIGWLVVGVLAFVAYRRHRGQPLWEPLETPPPPDREVEHGPIEPLPRSERVRMGRRQKIAGQVALPLPHPAHRQHRTRWLGLQLLVLRHGRLRATLGILVFAAISGLAIGVDLSRYDPFGPALQWSPGVVFVTLVAAYLLARSRAER